MDALRNWISTSRTPEGALAMLDYAYSLAFGPDIWQKSAVAIIASNRAGRLPAFLPAEIMRDICLAARPSEPNVFMCRNFRKHAMLPAVFSFRAGEDRDSDDSQSSLEFNLTFAGRDLLIVCDDHKGMTLWTAATDNYGANVATVNILSRAMKVAEWSFARITGGQSLAKIRDHRREWFGWTFVIVDNGFCFEKRDPCKDCSPQIERLCEYANELFAPKPECPRWSPRVINYLPDAETDSELDDD